MRASLSTRMLRNARGMIYEVAIVTVETFAVGEVGDRHRDYADRLRTDWFGSSSRDHQVADAETTACDHPARCRRATGQAEPLRVVGDNSGSFVEGAEWRRVLFVRGIVRESAS